MDGIEVNASTEGRYAEVLCDDALETIAKLHREFDGEPVCGAIFDFALFLFHNGQELLDRGSGPFFYLPKMESHLEARLWNDVFSAAEDHIPSRTDEQVAERARAAVRYDKEREAAAGFDGTWVAHPDSVEPAREEFDKVLGERPNQLDTSRDDVSVTAADLIPATEGDITEAGLRGNVNEKIRTEIGDDEWFEREGRPKESRELFEAVALSGNDEFVEFLTLPAYERLEQPR